MSIPPKKTPPSKKTPPPKKTPGDYEVGYRRPPRDSQFRPGQSGNPKGRPKGQPTMQEIFIREASRAVRIQVGGRIESVTTIEAAIRKLFNMAASGDLRAMTLILTASARQDAASGGPSEEAANEPAIGSIIPDDETLRRMLSRFDHLKPK